MSRSYRDCANGNQFPVGADFKRVVYVTYTSVESALSVGWSLQGHQSFAPNGSLSDQTHGVDGLPCDENSKLPNPLLPGKPR